MEIRYRDIVLRDEVEADIEDEIRWNTVETAWALWDGPWEMEKQLAEFDPEQYRQEEREALQKPKPDIRRGFEVDTADGTHIGSVNAYLIDENYQWIKRANVQNGQRVYDTVGIEINESAFWNRGLGTQALAAFIRYLLSQGKSDICLQTWSGNFRMVRCAEKLGFRLCKREEGVRHVRGTDYDNLTFHLDTDAFKAKYGEIT